MTNEQIISILFSNPQILSLITVIFILALGCISFIVFFIIKFIKKNGLEVEHGKTKLKIHGEKENSNKEDKEDKKENHESHESLEPPPVSINVNVNANNTNATTNTTTSTNAATNEVKDAIKDAVKDNDNVEETIQMSNNTFSLLMDGIEQVYEVFINKRDKLNQRASMQQIKIQKDALISAISNLHVLYTQQDATFSSDKADTLSLFLTRDFNEIINKEILDLLQLNDLNIADEEFINEQITSISNLCLTQMKSVIFNYPFIDTVLMRSILDRESHVVKNMVSMIVKQLSSVTKEQQQKILLLQKEKLDNLKLKLQSYINVEE